MGSPGVVLQEELESVQKRAAIFVTGNYNYETGSMTGILGQLKWESLKKRRKDNRLILLYKGLKGKASVPTDDLIPKLGVVEISTLRHFIKLFILVGLGRSFFVCCLAHRGSTVGFLLLQCSSGVVRHPRDLQVSVATHFCRVLIFASL